MYGIWQDSKSNSDKEKEKEDKSAYTKAENDARRVIGKAKVTEKSRWVDKFETQDAEGKEKAFKMQRYWWRKTKMF